MKINAASRFALLLLLPLFFGCKKDHNEEISKQVPLKGKLKSITLQNGRSDKILFSYTLDGLLKDIRSTLDIGLIVSEEFTSGPDGKTTTRTVYEGPAGGNLIKKYTYTYAYKNGFLHQIIRRRATASGAADNTTRFAYDQRNLLDSAIVTEELANGIQDVIRITKFNTAQNGNILEGTNKVIVNGKPTYITIETAEYDGKVNPFYGIFREDSGNAQVFCPQNMISSLLTSNASGLSVTTFAYDYSPAGFPVKKYRVSQQGETTLIEVYEYYE